MLCHVICQPALALYATFYEADRSMVVDSSTNIWRWHSVLDAPFGIYRAPAVRMQSLAHDDDNVSDHHR
jgi:hypothetical protein